MSPCFAFSIQIKECFHPADSWEQIPESELWRVSPLGQVYFEGSKERSLDG